MRRFCGGFAAVVVILTAPVTTTGVRAETPAITGRCDETVVPIRAPAAALRPFVDDHVPLVEVGGQVVVYLNDYSCWDIQVGGRQMPPLEWDEILVDAMTGEAPPGTKEYYMVWRLFDRKFIVKELHSMGLTCDGEEPHTPVCLVSVDYASALGPITTVDASVPWERSPHAVTGSFSDVRTPRAAFAAKLWYTGDRGLVAEDVRLTGMSLSPGEATVTDIPDATPLADMVGADRYQGPAALATYDFKARLTACGETPCETPRWS